MFGEQVINNFAFGFALLLTKTEIQREQAVTKHQAGRIPLMKVQMGQQRGGGKT